MLYTTRLFMESNYIVEAYCYYCATNKRVDLFTSLLLSLFVSEVVYDWLCSCGCVAVWVCVSMSLCRSYRSFMYPVGYIFTWVYWLVYLSINVATQTFYVRTISPGVKWMIVNWKMKVLCIVCTRLNRWANLCNNGTELQWEKPLRKMSECDYRWPSASGRVCTPWELSKFFERMNVNVTVDMMYLTDCSAVAPLILRIRGCLNKMCCINPRFTYLLSYCGSTCCLMSNYCAVINCLISCCN